VCLSCQKCAPAVRCGNVMPQTPYLAVLSNQKFHAVQVGNIHKSLMTLSCVIRGLADNQVS
jgi:hypothetical protein